VDALAKAASVTFEDKRYGFVANMRVKNCQLVLLKPTTYMNLSGNAVRYWMEKENIALENILVVVDDLSLPTGTLRLKGKGSDAGHNGLKHIAQILGSQGYARLKFGIGNDFPKGGQVDFVLGEFGAEDLAKMDERIGVASDMIKDYALQGIQHAMCNFNKK
jgi:PTH1 family peptidyl-tRNA hydrolase